MGIGNPLAGHTLHKSYKGMCIGTRMDQGSLEWLYEINGGSNEGVQAKILYLTSKSLFKVYENVTSSRDSAPDKSGHFSFVKCRRRVE